MDNEENQPSRPTGNIKTMSENPMANQLILNHNNFIKIQINKKGPGKHSI